MTVSEDRLGLADPPRNITSRDVRARGPVAPPTGVDDLPRYLRVTAARADADDLTAAQANCDLAIEAALRWNSAPALAAAHSLRTSVVRRRGNLAEAERDGRTAAGLLAAAGMPPEADASVLLLARRMSIRLDRGDVAGAELLLEGAGGDLPEGGGSLALRYVRGRLYAATDRPGEGLADLFHCGERLAARQADRPSVLPWRSAAAAILAGIGTPEAASRLVTAEVELARRSGPQSALGRALRIEGTVSGGRGVSALLEAVKVLERSPRRFEYAQALVDLGTALSTARRRPQARRVLREGLEIAEECGSPALADRAAAAYASAGGKLRPQQAAEPPPAASATPVPRQRSAD